MCDVCMGINSRNCPVCGREPEMTECPECGGTGGQHWAVSVETGEEMEVTPTTWSVLPETPEVARARRFRWYRGYFEKCRVCGGEGVLEQDEDYGPDPDDLYEERRLRAMEKEGVWER